MEHIGGYDELLTNHKKLQSEFANLQQSLHICKRELVVHEVTKADYLDEIERLKHQLQLQTREVPLTKEQLQDYQNQKSRALQLLDENNSLKDQLLNEQGEIKNLKKALQEANNRNKNIEEDGELEQQLLELKCRNNELATLAEGLEKQSLESQKVKTILEGTITDHVREIENYKEIVEYKNVKIAELNQLNDDLKDQILCLQSQIESLTTKPLDEKTRGNSLFAEVDDRRVQLQQKVNNMASQHLKMKQERATHLHQIKTLSHENIILQRKLESEVAEVQNDYELSLKCHEAEIRTLRKLVEDYQKALKEETPVPDNKTDEMRFYDGMLQMKNEEMEKLRETISQKSTLVITLNYDLIAARRATSRKDLEIMEMKKKLMELEASVKEKDLQEPSELKTDKMVVPKSILKVATLGTTMAAVKEDKENGTDSETTGKVVAFNENSVDSSNVTKRSGKMHGRCKVLISKPVMY